MFYSKLSLPLIACIYLEVNVKGRHLNDCSEPFIGEAPKYILINVQIRNLGTVILFHPYAVTSEPVCVFPILGLCPCIIYLAVLQKHLENPD